MNAPIRILGLDPGLRRTGWGVITAQGSRLTWIAHGVVTPPETLPLSERLLHLYEGISQVVAEHAPHEAAIEETFVTANGQSTLKLGHARACVMLAPASVGLSVAEYANNVVKKAVVGAGAADKKQVAFMIARLLPAAAQSGAAPTADAADALAVAVTHANLRAMRNLARRVA